LGTVATVALRSVCVFQVRAVVWAGGLLLKLVVGFPNAAGKRKTRTKSGGDGVKRENRGERERGRASKPNCMLRHGFGRRHIEYRSARVGGGERGRNRVRERERARTRERETERGGERERERGGGARRRRGRASRRNCMLRPGFGCRHDGLRPQGPRNCCQDSRLLHPTAV
jgi:hypothetical protein